MMLDPIVDEEMQWFTAYEQRQDSERIRSPTPSGRLSPGFQRELHSRNSQEAAEIDEIRQLSDQLQSEYSRLTDAAGKCRYKWDDDYRAKILAVKEAEREEVAMDIRGAQKIRDNERRKAYLAKLAAEKKELVQSAAAAAEEEELAALEAKVGQQEESLANRCQKNRKEVEDHENREELRAKIKVKAAKVKDEVERRFAERAAARTVADSS